MGERISVRRKAGRDRRKLKRYLIPAALILLLIMALLRGGDHRGEYIGTFDMSHYCLEQWNGYHICGNSPYGSGGDRLIPGKSLAVPASVLEKYPVGTEVILVYPDGEEKKFIVHDTGRALERLNRLDLPVETHKEALSLGVVRDVELYCAK